LVRYLFGDKEIYMTQILQANRFSVLREQIIGQVFEPSEAGFAKAVHGWELGYQHHPAVVVVASDTVDILETVQFAKANGFRIAVQSTGHGFVRDAKDQILLNVSRLKAVQINPVTKTATIQPGATWGNVLAAAHKHGLVGLVGDTPSVGAVGFVLGGGTSWFSRQYGMAIDSLLEAEIVTANGDLEVVNAQSNPDLFWAIRGGAGGFGVITRMTLQLYSHSKVAVGQFIFPFDQAKHVIEAYRDWIQTVPDQITSRLMLMRGPNAEVMPPFMRGKIAAMIQFVYAGTQLEAEPWVQSLKHIPNALLQMVDEISPTELGHFFGAPPAPTNAVGRADLFDHLSDKLIDTLLDQFALEQTSFYFCELRQLGGAISRIPDETTAFAHRQAQFLMNFRVLVSSPEEESLAQAYTKVLTQNLQPFMSGRVLPNFVVGDEGIARDLAAYPGMKATRVAMMKSRFDRHNLFAFARTPGSR
jgi:hypothetical protein